MFIFLNFLLSFSGLMLYMMYGQCDPLLSGRIERRDQVSKATKTCWWYGAVDVFSVGNFILWPWFLKLLSKSHFPFVSEGLTDNMASLLQVMIQCKKKREKYWRVRRTSYFWALRSFQIVTCPLFRTKLYLGILCITQWISKLWNPPQEAVPGNYHRSDGHSKHNCQFPHVSGKENCANYQHC